MYENTLLCLAGSLEKLRIVCSKCSRFKFEFNEGQNIKVYGSNKKKTLTMPPSVSKTFKVFQRLLRII